MAKEAVRQEVRVRPHNFASNIVCPPEDEELRIQQLAPYADGGAGTQESLPNLPQGGCPNALQHLTHSSHAWSVVGDAEGLLSGQPLSEPRRSWGAPVQKHLKKFAVVQLLDGEYQLVPHVVGSWVQALPKQRSPCMHPRSLGLASNGGLLPERLVLPCGVTMPLQRAQAALSRPGVDAACVVFRQGLHGQVAPRQRRDRSCRKARRRQRQEEKA
mmetsp:Transcript_86188/g.216912  ORF Transcript_86188/g.216912 Transcript_86188/m.216912 type:complete len:215 (+) Transcript_86188:826-1470(+)